MLQPELHVLIRVRSTRGNGVKLTATAMEGLVLRRWGDSSVVGGRTHDQ